jgi:hypothetical protein|tara:strand:- start:2832 stop:3068 length:237 start_codon:yes stop_codon:yes gene_type:complete
MSKKITVFVDDTEQSRIVLGFIVKNKIAHKLVTDQTIVEKIKQTSSFEPPIVLCYDEETNEYSILENKQELMEIKNGS